VSAAEHKHESSPLQVRRQRFAQLLLVRLYVTRQFEITEIDCPAEQLVEALRTGIRSKTIQGGTKRRRSQRGSHSATIPPHAFIGREPEDDGIRCLTLTKPAAEYLAKPWIV
jgi:hypothetical protein